MADVGLADAGAGAFLWRHLFSARQSLWEAGIQVAIAEPGAVMEGRSDARRGIGRESGRAVEGVCGAGIGTGRSGAGRVGFGVLRIFEDLRFAAGRVRRRAEISAAERE